MGNYTNTTIIADFMSVNRKVPLNKFSCIRDALEQTWNMVTKVAEAIQIESTRASRSNDAERI